MTNHGTAGRGSIGGSADEVGSDFRASIAAWAVVHGLKGDDLPGLDLPKGQAVPDRVALETDDDVDDIRIDLGGGGRAYFQAKHTVSFSAEGPFADALAQWRKGAGSYNAKLDRIVLCSASVSEPLKDLDAALKRRRLKDDANAATTAEKRELDKLRERLNDLDAPKLENLLDVLVILELDIERPSLGEQGRCEALLDGLVVVSGQGTRAWKELKSTATLLARTRGSRRLGGWIRALREAKCSLVEDITKSRAAYCAAETAAVGRYRDMVLKRANEIDLRPMGVDVSPIEFPDAERQAISASVVEDDGDAHSARLADLVRRRRRIIISGDPGSGKSTALRSLAAEYVKDTGYLPLRVRMSALDLKEGADALKALLDAALAPVGDGGDRALLRPLLEDGLKRGFVAVLLDALDETLEHRGRVVKHTQRLMEFFHEETEIAVATRDFALPAALTLKFAHVRIDAPPLLEEAIERIVKAICTANGRPNETGERTEWVLKILGDDSFLKRVPLFQILLAIISAETTDMTGLPRRRAAILAAVLDGVVTRWETKQRRGGQVTLGPLHDDLARLVLTETFHWLSSRVLLDRLPADDAAATCAAELRADWALARVPAEAAVTAAINFWDQAGILVARDEPPMLEASMRAFSEIGAARRITKLPAPQRRAEIDRLMPIAATRQTLLLAAGLSTDTTIDVIDVALANNTYEALIVAADAAFEARIGAGEKIEKLVDALVGQFSDDVNNAWRIGVCITRLPLAETRREGVIFNIIAELPQEYGFAIEVIASLNWNPDAVPAGWRAFLLSPAIHLPGGALPKRFRRVFAAVDPVYDDAVIAVAKKLLDANVPDSRPLIVNAVSRVSRSASTTLRAALVAHGHQDPLDSKDNDIGKKMLETVVRNESSHQTLLECVAALAPPADLAPHQHRRLDELASFLAAVPWEFISAVDVDAAMAHARTEAQEVLSILASLCPHAPALLAAEAQVALTLGDARRAVVMLHDAATPLTFAWGDVAGKAMIKDRLLELLAWGLWFSCATWAALETYPDKAALDQQLRAILENVDDVKATRLALLFTSSDAERFAWAERFVEADDLDDTNDASNQA